MCIIACLAAVQSFGSPERLWLYLSAAGALIALCTTGKTQSWSTEACALAFVFCAVTANHKVTGAPFFTSAISAYHVRPASLVLAIACVMVMLRQRTEPRPPSSAPGRVLVLVTLLLSITLIAGYSLLSMRYPLEQTMLLTSLSNVLVTLGSYLFAHAILLGQRSQTERFIIVLSVVGMALSSAAGRLL